MRTSNILLIIWFVIVIVLDKFVQSYYNFILLIISGIFLYGIHRANMSERVETGKDNKKEVKRSNKDEHE